MALARAMTGDSSDNLPGVSRVGFKTIAGKLPFMKEEEVSQLMNCLNTART